jgi:uncharacterized protein YqgV (UPF0045/DUF77 family)
MKITIEITMYPLREDYEEQVLQFLDLLKKDDAFLVKVNAMSTQLTGEYDQVMERINSAIKSVYSSEIKASFVMKVLPGSLDLDYSHTA